MRGIDRLAKVVGVGAFLLSAGSLSAQEVRTAAFRTPRFPPGQLVELASSEANPRQQYAVYVPSSYRAESEWPLLIVMDPRGRAMIPLSRLREASERLGYIAISSYNS